MFGLLAADFCWSQSCFEQNNHSVPLKLFILPKIRSEVIILKNIVVFNSITKQPDSIIAMVPQLPTLIVAEFVYFKNSWQSCSHSNTFHSLKISLLGLKSIYSTGCTYSCSFQENTSGLEAGMGHARFLLIHIKSIRSKLNELTPRVGRCHRISWRRKGWGQHRFGRFGRCTAVSRGAYGSIAGKLRVCTGHLLRNRGMVPSSRHGVHENTWHVRRGGKEFRTQQMGVLWLERFCTRGTIRYFAHARS